MLARKIKPVMKAITYTLKILVFLTALFAASHSFGQNTMYYAFIPNGAGNIDQDGFDIGYHSIYSEWDLNGDGDISETEFYTVMFQRLDTNKNGSLSSKEWAYGQKYIFGQFLDGRNSSREQDSRLANNKVETRNSGFNGWDTNKDKKITPGEFDSGMRKTNLFRSYDSNKSGKLNRKELNTGVYNSMDLDGNGIIEKNEFAIVGNLFIN